MTSSQGPFDPMLPHRETLELLPWYVNESLGEAERERLHRHLELCPDCRLELERERRLMAAVRGPQTMPSIDPEAGLALVGRRIAERPRAASWWHPAQLWRTLKTAPPAWRLASLVPTAIALVLAVLLLAPPVGHEPAAGAEPGPAGFTLLSTAAPPTVRVWVEFDPAAPEGRLRALLLDLGAEIVEGPKAGGTYTLALPSSPELTSQELVARLGASELVVRAVLAGDA